MSNLHARLGGQVEPEPPAAPSPTDVMPVGDFATIRCRAGVTELQAPNLIADIAAAATRSRQVVVDLSATGRIDAAGLGALVSGARSCRDAGSRLHIVGAHGMVARALQFTGLASALSSRATGDHELHD